jgi:BlaI family transcriptional regulator, penicillinase repressor
MKQLTRAEEQVMQILWDLNEAIVKQVVDNLPEPKPAYTTVATVLKVLEKKGFALHKTIGNVHIFSPAIPKRDYTRFQFSNLLKNYFNGSFPRMATFFAHENNLTLSDLEEMMRLAEAETKKNDKTE